MEHKHLVPALLVCLIVTLAAFPALILWRLSCCCKKRNVTPPLTRRRVTITNSPSLRIGFRSNGDVYLDGIKLAFESDKAPCIWGRIDHVIGCGFYPRQKKVFFTVDSELVHVVQCKSEFGAPLYPTLAANTDIEVLANFGQSVFKYAPANVHRTPNSCFVGPLRNGNSGSFHEDSKELFSMERIDSQWLNRNTTRGNQYQGSTNQALDLDEESSDLFEIVLDACGRSPNTVL